MTIRSKVHQYGNEKESSWPSQFGTGEKGVFHLDNGEVKEGYPPQRHEKFGTPPLVIFDSMPETYHNGACRPVESRKEWERLDKECGTITFGSKESAKPALSEEKKEQMRREEARKDFVEAMHMYRANPKEVKQKLAKRAEQQIERLKKSGLQKPLEQQGVKIHE